MILENSAIDTPTTITGKFGPVTNVFKLFGISQFPYKSKISFLPLIRYWEQQLKSDNRVDRLIAQEIKTCLDKDAAVLKKPIDKLEALQDHEYLIALLTSVYSPYNDVNDLLRLSGPFNTLPFYHSPALKTLLQQNLIASNLDKDRHRVFQFITYRAGCLILNRFYKQQLKELDPHYIFSVKNKDSELIKYFRAQVDSRFIDVKKCKPLKRLTKATIHQMLSNIEDVDLWLKHLPPDNFEFQGINGTLLVDATIPETLSRLKNFLLDKDALVSADKIAVLKENLCTFFNQSGLQLGVCSLDTSKTDSLGKKYGIKHSLLSHKFSNLFAAKNKGSIYDQAIQRNDFVVVEDLAKLTSPKPAEAALLSKGIHNIIIAPLHNRHRKIIGLLELGSPDPYSLNSYSVLKLKGIISLFGVALERSMEEVDNQIEAIIRDQFTSIHPSVEWVFLRSAFETFHGEGKEINEDKFVFRKIYPLYGQADIVSSTAIRNKAVQADLMDHLYQIKKILGAAIKELDFPVAHQLLSEVDAHIEWIKRGVSSNNEYNILEFIKSEIHPLFRLLRKKSKTLKEVLRRYYAYLDPQLGIVYKRRKNYEDSVAKINKVLSNYLDGQQSSTQDMCPYYFEKFQTDGLAYNIYIGQSLLRKGKFSSFHLRNLRLWQLISMCDITRTIAHLQSELPVPLTTAQLILVHSSPLSIRFRLDEKRFDVDGAYNARYEIVKKRIDKALIEGSNERLTQSGKVAIVYQHENDRKEYLRYLKFLIKKGLIEKPIEELSLKRLQGVQGLKALRVTVKI